MLNVSIIGSGNVAQHLIRAFAKSDKIQLVQVYSRRRESLLGIVEDQKTITDLSLLTKVDLYIIAVSDSAIEEVSAKLPFADRLVAHTSGGLGLGAILGGNRAASFYPLQTFSKHRELNMHQVPICIETSDPSDEQAIRTAAAAISDVVCYMDSAQRRALHVAAVFACNFTNHMYDIAGDICAGNNIDFNILKPLITETANKIMLMSPREAQTGPARRNDQVTIKKHIDFLQNDDHKHLYSLISNSILEYAKKL